MLRDLRFEIPSTERREMASLYVIVLRLPFPSEEGQAALSFRFLLHRCIDNLVYFPDARAVLKFRPGDEGRMGIVDLCAGCLKFGLPLAQSPSKISG